MNSQPNLATPSINADAFLLHLITQLRELGVDMSPTGAPENLIALVPRHPSEQPARECYQIQCWGKTPDYKGEQPAYRTDMHYYPQDHLLFVNCSYNGEWNSLLFPYCDGMNPVEFSLKQHGLTDTLGRPLQVICE